MAGRLFVYGIDQVKGVLREVSLICFRFNPYGKELRAQVSTSRLKEADVADIVRIG